MFDLHVKNYISKLDNVFNDTNIHNIEILANMMLEALNTTKKIFIFGNGGSAGNAIHLANDFLYGAGKNHGKGLSIESLSANPAVLTCLANDISYDDIYSEQIKVKGSKDDLVIALSGSGNSKNISKAIEVSNTMELKTFAILGYDGGIVKELTDYPIHFSVNDMQISEDLQLMVGHICMQWIVEN
jgi:D-sedoheptulose 7-phosphate isomerase